MKTIAIIIGSWILWITLAFGWKAHDFETSKIETYDVIETVERKGEIYAVYQTRDRLESYRLAPEEIYMRNHGIFNSVNIRTMNEKNTMLETFGGVFLLFSLVFLLKVALLWSNGSFAT